MSITEQGAPFVADAEALRGALMAHRLTYGAWADCACGWRGPRVDAVPAWEQHVTAALLASGVVQPREDAVRSALLEARDAWQWGEWVNAPRCADRVQERIANAQHVTDWLTVRAALAPTGATTQGGAES